MNKKSIKNTQPICIGAGLVALDVILNGKPETPMKIFAGGSCGNVLSILSFLGWTSFPIARLKNDVAGNELLTDLKKWKVKTSLITFENDGSTPIIIQRIKEDKSGNLIHRFEFRNPDTGEWLPRYKPVLSADVPELVKKQERAEVFYFDRVNRAALDLAGFYKSSGAIIFFEPSSFSDEKQFEEALSISDIIKFSGERISDYSKRFPVQKALLEIETLGENGVRFRFGADKKQKKWNTLSTYKISNFKDAAGAGDWTSAGIISTLAAGGISGLMKASENKVASALKYGQALGALNCLYDGARGLMYNINRSHLDEIVEAFQKKPSSFATKSKKQTVKKPVTISELY